MGIQDHTSKAPTKSQQQHEAEEAEEHESPESPGAAEQPKESCPVPGTWSPLLANVCLCTALALSAYVCYRAYFHWCLSFLLLFVPPFLSTVVAKWTRLANQPALTPGLLCEWVDYLDFSGFRFTCLIFTNAVQKGWLVGNSRLPILITHPNVLSICRHWCSGPQFFRCHIPNICADLNTDWVCIAVCRGGGFVSAPQFCEPGWMACQPILHASPLLFTKWNLCVFFHFILY